jgi:hypothetical protein
VHATARRGQLDQDDDRHGVEDISPAASSTGSEPTETRIDIQPLLMK